MHAFLCCWLVGLLGLLFPVFVPSWFSGRGRAQHPPAEKDPAGADTPLTLAPRLPPPPSIFPPPLHPSAPLPLPQVTQNEGLRMLCSKAQAID